MDKKEYLLILVIAIYHRHPKRGKLTFNTSHYYTRKLVGNSQTDIKAELGEFQRESFMEERESMSATLDISVNKFDTKFQLEIFQLTVTTL